MSWRSGQDVNWDWNNYHDYVPWALFNNRLWIDVAPASIQSYLNPLPLIPDYLAVNFLPMPVGALLMGAIQGTAIAVTWMIAARLVGVSLAFVAAVIAASGPLMLSEVGTSFPDLLTAIPILAGLYLLLFASEDNSRRAFWAGILFGVAVGAKLSNAPFLIAALAASLPGPGRQQRVFRLGLGVAIGGAAAAGPWAFVMWHEFGNPVFPFYNGIFHAPESAPINFADRRFLPNGIADWMGYPFRWLVGQHPSAEIPFRDARFAILVLIAPLAIGARLGRGKAIFCASEVRLFVFMSVAYVVWSVVFSIQRYLIPLELLAGPVIVLIMVKTLPKFAGVIASGLLAAVIALWSIPPDWGRYPWSAPYKVDTSNLTVKTPSLFFMLDVPTALVVRHLPPGSRVFSLAGGGMLPLPKGQKLDMRIREALKTATPEMLWTIGHKGATNGRLAEYGLEISKSRPCQTIPGTYWGPIDFCPLERIGNGK